MRASIPPSIVRYVLPRNRTQHELVALREGERLAAPRHHHQRIADRHRQRPQQDGVHEAVDRGVGADAERQRQNREHGHRAMVLNMRAEARTAGPAKARRAAATSRACARLLSAAPRCPGRGARPIGPRLPAVRRAAVPPPPAPGGTAAPHAARLPCGRGRSHHMNLRKSDVIAPPHRSASAGSPSRGRMPPTSTVR